jgi:restriction system protein
LDWRGIAEDGCIGLCPLGCRCTIVTEMAIPDYETLMFPTLQFSADGKEHSAKELVDSLAVRFSLTPAELSETLPSGQKLVFSNRAGWATTYLKKAGLLTAIRRGVFRITQQGAEVLRTRPQGIDNEFLRRYSIEFREFCEVRELAPDSKPEVQAPLVQRVESRQTPEELLERSYQTLRTELASAILQRVLAGSPEAFERLVVELLVAMGYGGSRKDAGEAVGRSGDGGIDGIIKEDRLGLDTIYIQAKRWDQPVSRPEIQKFVGALQGVRARKGVFITTSRYTDDAAKYAANVDTRLVLIDGPALARYMIDFGLGVSTVAAYEIKRIDSDYFDEEQD